jgi:Alcohol dehydrogenase transcription factor Myb/SANT-like
MDIKGLIEEVRKRPVLWDPKHKYYHHRNILATEWTNISLTLGIQSEEKKMQSNIFHFQPQFFFFVLFLLRQTESVCKTKWKGLRDNYRKEMKKCLRRKKLDKNSSSTWVHFQALSFLKRVIGE